jgi:hypothetical protein
MNDQHFFTATSANDPFPKRFVVAPFSDFGVFVEHVGPEHPEVRFWEAFRSWHQETKSDTPRVGAEARVR